MAAGGRITTVLVDDAAWAMVSSVDCSSVFLSIFLRYVRSEFRPSASVQVEDSESAAFIKKADVARFIDSNNMYIANKVQ